MSKIVKIKFENFKAISELEADFKGCTAIVTGGNNMGKSSFLKGMPERIRFIRPSVMVKEGSKAGKGAMTLDTGERFEWVFNTDGKDELKMFTTEGAKRDVTKVLGATYFPTSFDIDKFLNSSPKEQGKQLQKIVGLDFADVDKRYAEAYQFRTDKNSEAERFQVKLSKLMEVPYVKPVDLAALQAKKDAERTRLNELYKSNKAHNASLRSEWDNSIKEITETENKRVKDIYEDSSAKNAIIRNEYTSAKEMADTKERETKAHNDKWQGIYKECHNAASVLHQHGCPQKEINNWLVTVAQKYLPEYIAKDNYPDIPTYFQENFDPIYSYPKEPTYIPEMPSDETLQAIDAEIFEASQTNIKAKAYTDYVEYKEQVEQAVTAAANADIAVKNIEAERNEMIAGANFPKGIAVTLAGLTVDGLPLDRSQLSSSRITIAALQIAALNIGEVKALFFDASYLDKNSLGEVTAWAEAQGLQLLIERPAYEGGEIEYQLIENTIA